MMDVKNSVSTEKTAPKPKGEGLRADRERGRGRVDEESKKKFEKMLSRVCDDVGEVEDQEKEKESGKQAPQRSLFDLCTHLAPKAKPDECKEQYHKQCHEQCQDVVSFDVELDLEDVEEGITESDEELEETEEKPLARNEKTPFQAVVAPQAVRFSTAHIEQKEEAPMRSKVLLQELVKELASAMKVVSTKQKTETEVTLRHPPLFKGTTIIVTEQHSAKKQLNITFVNLTNPTARALIENPSNEHFLRTALLERGYTLQMVTIEPKLEIRVSAGELKDFGSADEYSDDQNEDLTSF